MTTELEVEKESNAASEARKSAVMPIQPIFTDGDGSPRFLANRIVQFVLKNSSIDLNILGQLSDEFTREEEMQFAQLIGYSTNGHGSLSYVNEETYVSVLHMNAGFNEKEARTKYLRETLSEARGKTRELAEILFNISEEDLKD